MNRVVELRQAGHTAPEIAEGAERRRDFYPPKRRGQFTTPVVHQLLKRRGLIGSTNGLTTSCSARTSGG